MNKKNVDDLELKGKKVFLRVDFNVPLDKNLNVTDDTRIVKSIPTIQKLISSGAKTVLVSHLGRPKGKPSEEYSLKPVLPVLSGLLEKDVKFIDVVFDEKFSNSLNNLADGEVALLENIRFVPEEEKNDTAFSEKVASFFDLYVNDSFGTAHRAHASTHGIASCFDQPVCGYLMESEINFLTKVLSGKERPFTAIIGGAKVKDKIPVLLNLVNLADSILIGGGMAYTFLKSEGFDIGSSILQEEHLGIARKIIDKAKATGCQIFLPMDHVVANKFSNDTEIEVSPTNIPNGLMALDIGDATIKIFGTIIRGSKRILWNGPMGVFEMEKFQKGTFAMAKAIAETDCLSIVGGGDSVAAVKASGYAGKMSHISTGGGASLEFMEGKVLPGLYILANKG